MARRLLVDIDNRILDAVCEIGSDEGMSAISTQKVAKMCGISHFTCFDHFGTKQNMLDRAAIRFENRYMGILMNHMSNTLDIEQLWLDMLEELTKNGTEFIYYLKYTSAFGFKPTPQNINFELYKGALIKALGDIPGFTDEMYMLTWDYLSTQCFLYARYIVKKQMPDTPENREFAKNLVFKGVNRVVSLDD